MPGRASGGAVRWGILSTAGINAKLPAGARDAGNASVVAVASRDHGRPSATPPSTGSPAPNGSYEALLADPEIEVVYIPLKVETALDLAEERGL